MKSSWIAVILFVFVCTAVIGGVYFLTRQSEESITTEPITTTEDAIKALTETPLPGTDLPTNPLENKVPDVNPVTKTNPFKNVYRNPFAP